MSIFNTNTADFVKALNRARLTVAYQLIRDDIAAAVAPLPLAERIGAARKALQAVTITPHYNRSEHSGESQRTADFIIAAITCDLRSIVGEP